MNRFATLLFALLPITSEAGPVSPLDEAKSTQIHENVPLADDAEGNRSGRLGGNAFSLRRRSTLDLWRDRDRYRGSVVAAARSEDPETAERARWILTRWQRGVLVDTPPDLAEKLITLSPDQAIEHLLEAGEFAAATIAMQESYDTLDFVTVSARVSINLDQRFPVYARNAVKSNRTAEFAAFLDIASTTPAMAVCRRDWAMLFSTDDAPEMETRLPTSAETWDGDLAHRTQVLLHLLAGNVDAAMKSARSGTLTAPEKADGPDHRGDAVFASLQDQQQPPLVRSIRMLDGQWTAMAVSAEESARAWENAAIEVTKNQRDQRNQANPGSRPPAPTSIPAKIELYRTAAIRQWSDALIAADRCEDQNRRAAAVAGLRENVRALGKHEKKSKSIEEARSLAWRCLVIHGELGAGLEIVGQDDPAGASEIASAASRHSSAFEILGYPADQIDIHLESWIDEAISAQHELFEAMDDPISEKKNVLLPKMGIVREIQDLLALIPLLDGVNRDDAAWRIAERLSLPDLHFKTSLSSNTYLVRDEVLTALRWTSHSDWMIQLGMRDWETESTARSRYIIGKVTVIDNYQVLEILHRFVQMRQPQQTAIHTFRIACEIARAESIDRRQHADLVAELAHSLNDGSLRHALADDSELLAYLRPTIDVWSDLFVAHGRADLAETFLQQRSSVGDLQAALTLATKYRWSGPAAASHDLHQLIWDAVASSPGYGNPAFQADMVAAVTAVGEQWRAARDAGDLAMTADLLLQLRAMACTPSSDMRRQIADVLADLSQWPIAEEIYRSLLVMTSLSSQEPLAMLEVARKYRWFALKATASRIETTESEIGPDPGGKLTSAEWSLRRDAIEKFDGALIQTLNQVSLRPELYVDFPRSLAREQLELAIGNSVSQPPAATAQSTARWLQRSQQLDRLDISTAESVFPKLVKMGMDDRIALEIRRMMEVAEKHLRTFPSDAVVANNVAWAAAVNNVELDGGLRLARRAVQMEPDSAIYRDTLAEILARKGNFTEAVQIERGCLMDDPGQWHLHQQINRFEKKLIKSR